MVAKYPLLHNPLSLCVRVCARLCLCLCLQTRDGSGAGPEARRCLDVVSMG